jgi:hypothetical protein
MTTSKNDELRKLTEKQKELRERLMLLEKISSELDVIKNNPDGIDVDSFLDRVKELKKEQEKE